jgi:Holliday junction DNA helicase RuvB
MIEAANDAALIAGMGYLLDEQGTPTINVHVHVESPKEPEPVLINAADGLATTALWDTYVGQEPAKRELMVNITSAKQRNIALPHVLLATPRAGYGKTTLAHLVAAEMGRGLFKLVPPFEKKTLHEALKTLPHQGILFIDEIHKLADMGGRKGAEILLHILEEGVIYDDDGTFKLPDITVIGTTTELHLLPQTIRDRFSIKPYFEEYDDFDMAEIIGQFMGSYGVQPTISVIEAIIAAADSTPRLAREMVRATRALADSMKRMPTGAELLDFKQLDTDGLHRQGRDYVREMYTRYRRVDTSGNVYFIAGEAAMASILYVDREELAEIERALMKRGLIDRTPQGRRLTPAGIERAQQILQE